MKAHVTVEEGWLGEDRWAVIINRPDRLLRRTLWKRYASQAEATKGAEAARAYLRDTERGVEERHADRANSPNSRKAAAS